MILSNIAMGLADLRSRRPTRIHRRGIVDSQPGLHFGGLFFLYAMSSGFFRGVGRDAGYVVETIAARKDRDLHTEWQGRWTSVVSQTFVVDLPRASTAAVR